MLPGLAARGGGPMKNSSVASSILGDGHSKLKGFDGTGYHVLRDSS